MCTQALPESCSVCSTGTGSEPQARRSDGSSEGVSTDAVSDPPSPATGVQAMVDSKGERCSSCSLSLPNDVGADQAGLQRQNRNAAPAPNRLRTKEVTHICGTMCSTYMHERLYGANVICSPELFNEMMGELPCHSHQVDYVSSFSPVKPDTFSDLRSATIRTLSGEQLPRGQSCGPLLFGDSNTGYTIAYGFRLADLHARGRQRYYALVALAGSETSAAIAACTVLWAFFEKIVTHILQSAGEVTARASAKETLQDSDQVIPVSSFLIGRATDPDGFPRSGAQFRVNGIVDLVGNENFFYELHLAFVTILQTLRAPERASKPHGDQKCVGLHSTYQTQSKSDAKYRVQRSSPNAVQPLDPLEPDKCPIASAQTRPGRASALDQCPLQEPRYLHQHCEGVTC